MKGVVFLVYCRGVFNLECFGDVLIRFWEEGGSFEIRFFFFYYKKMVCEFFVIFFL